MPLRYVLAAAGMGCATVLTLSALLYGDATAGAYDFEVPGRTATSQSDAPSSWMSTDERHLEESSEPLWDEGSWQ